MEGGYLDHNPAWRTYKYSGKKKEKTIADEETMRLVMKALEKESIKYEIYHRSTRANTPDSASFRRFLPFSPWRAPARLRLKKQKSLENPSLSGAGQFFRNGNVSRRGKTRREY